MKKYRFTLNLEYEVEVEDEDDAYNELEEQIRNNNTIVENEFWDNLELEEIKND